MYLYKPSDRSSSEPVDFWYYPSSSNSRKQENQVRKPLVLTDIYTSSTMFTTLEFRQTNYQEHDQRQQHQQLHGHNVGSPHDNYNGKGVMRSSTSHQQMAPSSPHNQPIKGRASGAKRERERPSNRGNDDPSSG